MLRVTIDLVPMGDESRKRVLGVMEIANDGQGTSTSGNYMVRLCKAGQPKAIWRRGGITGFPRARLGVYDLLLRCLVATVGQRNRPFIEDLKEDLAEQVAA